MKELLTRSPSHHKETIEFCESFIENELSKAISYSGELERNISFSQPNTCGGYTPDEIELFGLLDKITILRHHLKNLQSMKRLLGPIREMKDILMS